MKIELWSIEGVDSKKSVSSQKVDLTNILKLKNLL